jgi:nucleoid DNA-binding protein
MGGSLSRRLHVALASLAQGFAVRMSAPHFVSCTMATAKKVPAPAAQKTRAATPAVKTAAVQAASPKPIKQTFTKAALTAHLAEQSAVEPKAVKAMLAALESTVLGAVHKKGAGEFSLLGLVKIDVLQVAAKKKRFGKDPFSGEERWFDAKPATVRIKARALKKLKDAVA